MWAQDWCGAPDLRGFWGRVEIIWGKVEIGADKVKFY